MTMYGRLTPAQWIAKMWGNSMPRSECDKIPRQGWAVLVRMIGDGLAAKTPAHDIITGWVESEQHHLRGGLHEAHFDMLEALIDKGLRGEEIAYVPRHYTLDQKRSLDSIMAERRRARDGAR
jgi:hypothetical protein